MLVRNLLALSKTQVILVGTDLPHLRPRSVAARDHSKQSSGVNRRLSGCEAFRFPHLARLVLRSAAPVLLGAADTLSPPPVELDLSPCGWKVAPAFRHQPSGRYSGASAPTPRVAKSTPRQPHRCSPPATTYSELR